MPDYSNSRIYKIIDNTNGNIYIGSTTQTLSRRLAKHKGHYQSYLNDNNNFMTSFDIIQNGNYEIVLIENVNCETKEQLHARERFHIENNKCLNKVIPTRTRHEYNRYQIENNKEHIQQQKHKHYEKYKETIKEKHKTYYDNNSDKIKEQRKQYREEHQEERRKQYTCECGGTFLKRHQSIHQQTNKHQQYINGISLLSSSQTESVPLLV